MSQFGSVWNFIDKQFKEEPTWRSLEGGTDEEIKKAERILELEFHPDYKKYLKRYGGGSPFALDIYGLHPTGIMTSNFSVITNTKFYRDQKWPNIQKWYIVSDDGRGNPIGIDPNGGVWLSDHDSGFEQVKIADTFEEFLYKLQTDTLFE
jgi:hypothetical protein